MRGFFCEPRKPFFPILKRKIFLGIFGWKLLTIKSTGFVLLYFLWVCFFGVSSLITNPRDQNYRGNQVFKIFIDAPKVRRLWRACDTCFCFIIIHSRNINPWDVFTLNFGKVWNFFNFFNFGKVWNFFNFFNFGKV